MRYISLLCNSALLCNFDVQCGFCRDLNFSLASRWFICVLVPFSTSTDSDCSHSRKQHMKPDVSRIDFQQLIEDLRTSPNLPLGLFQQPPWFPTFTLSVGRTDTVDRVSMLTRHEAAKELRISVATLDKLARSGAARPTRIGRRVLYPREEIDRLRGTRE